MDSRPTSSIQRLDDGHAVFCWGMAAEGQLGLGGIEDAQVVVPRELPMFNVSGWLLNINSQLLSLGLQDGHKIFSFLHSRICNLVAQCILARK